MFSGIEMTHQRCRNRRHAARGAARGFSAFQRAHARLEHGHGGIGVATIDKAFLIPLEAGLGLLGGCINVARVEEDGLGCLAELASERALMHEPGRRSPGVAWRFLVFLRHHGRYSSKSHAGTKKPGTWRNAKRPG